MNSLVLFTLNYPYGKGEAFIDSEISVLSRKFDSIYILPSIKVKGIRPLPENVYIVDTLTKRNSEISISNIFIYLGKLLKLFAYTIITSTHRTSYFKYWKSFLGFAIDDLSKQRYIEQIIVDKKLHSAIFYDYWFVNATLSISNLKRKGIISKAVARCHRFDLYDEELHEGVVSFREYKFKYLDMIMPISLHGKKYLLNKVKHNNANKVNHFYLGIGPGDLRKDRKPSESFRIVSCARVVKHKDVSKIVDVLSKLKYKVHWIHFGDGPLLAQVRKKCKKLPNNISFDLVGEVSNQTIIDYYSNNQVSLFLSLSKSEGLPVSMMEALMHGIPVVAISVCGIPELVVPGCGYLLKYDASTDEIARELTQALQQKFDKEYMAQITNEKFNAYTNYTQFSDFLIRTFNR